MKTIIYFIKKELLQFKRDPKMFALILGAPIIQLIFLGYAANLDVEVVHTAIYDMDKTSTSRNYIEKFESSGYFQIDYYVSNYERLTELIDDGEITVGVVIPNNFESKIKSRETASVQALFDGSDANSTSIAAGYVQGVTSGFAQNIITGQMQRLGMKTLPFGSVEAETRVWYNPELKTRVFMVPAIVGLLLMIITLILTSLAIVKEKEIGTLEQLIVTPIKPHQMIIGKLVPFVLLGNIAVVIVLAAMVVIFGIHIRGSVLFLFLSSFVFVLSTLGFGLFVSTISRTQQQAMMLAIFAIMLPMVYLSGFAFPIENMPEAIQYVTYAIPLRYFMTIIRGVILKGIGFAELWQELGLMFLLGVVILVASVMRFQKKLD